MLFSGVTGKELQTISRQINKKMQFFGVVEIVDLSVSVSVLLREKETIFKSDKPGLMSTVDV